MNKWIPKIYKGDYIDRQQQANKDHAVCYCEQHFNSYNDPETNYSMCIVGTNASQTSKDWGSYYSMSVANCFNIQNKGINIGGYSKRGNHNIYHTHMPAILLEPFFLSSNEGVLWLMEDWHWVKYILALTLIDSIKTFFPNGGIVGLSVGHMYKTSHPNDKGAKLPVNLNIEYYEADFADEIINEVYAMLEKT